PVFQHEPRDAALAQVSRDVIAFVVHPQGAMSAAGRDHHGRTCRLVLWWQVERDGGLVHAGDDMLALRLRDADRLRGGLSFRSRRAIGPEKDYLRVGGSRDTNRKQSE